MTAAAAFFFLLPLPVLSQAASISTVAGVAAGGNHSAAIKQDGSLWAWGSNGSGQLGYDTDPENISTSPRQVGVDNDWARLSLGSFHTVALKTDGTLWVWGRNVEGQLGDGTNTGKKVPTRIGMDTDWAAVAAGDQHSVALKTDGTLWAWGSNIFGQLGDGTTETRFVPRQVGTDSDWRAVTAGSFFNLAVKLDGSLWAWGHNFSGQIGDGTSGVNRFLPVRIGSPDIVWREVAAGNEHALSLDADGNLWAWGRNSWGQFGDGTTVASLLPLQVPSGVAWRKVVAGGNFSAGVRADGTLWTWGDNSWGQLGDGGGLGFYRPSPGQVGTAANWLDAAAGSAYTLALKGDGSFQGWGSNQNGQLGDGTLNDTVARTVSIDPVTTPTNIPSQMMSGTADLQTVRVSVLVTDAAGNVVSVGDATLTGTSWSYHVTGLAEGENTIVATATDDVQFDTARAMAAIFYDGIPPVAPDVTSVTLTSNSTPSWNWSGGGGGNGTFRYKLGDDDLTQDATETTLLTFTPTVALTDGVHTLYVQERDAVGNWSASGSQTIVVDTLPPAPPQVTGPDVTNNPTPTWSWSLGGGNGTFRYKLGDGDLTQDATETTLLTFTPAVALTDGVQTLYVQERDAAGNWSVSGSRTIEIDLVPPSLWVSSPFSPTNFPDLRLVGTVEPGSTLTVTVDSTATVATPNLFAGNFQCEISDLAEGFNSVTVIASDAAGNQTVETFTVELDTTPPNVAFDYYATPTSSPSQMIRGSREAGVEVSLASDTDAAIGPVSYPTADTWSFFVTGLAPGENTIEATATDAVGNVTRVVRTISHDPAVPTLTIDSLATLVNLSSQMIGGRRSTEAAVSVQVDSGAGIGPITYPTPDTWSCSLDGLTEGANGVVVTATGPAAGTDAEVFATIIFDPVAPTVTLDTLVTPTNDPGQTIGGSRSVGATIAIATEFWATVDDIVYPTETTWSCAVSGLIEANNIVVVTAVGFDGNGASLLRNVSYDAAAPAVTIDPPASPTAQPDVTLAGTIEPGATVSIASDTAASDGNATVDPEGNWSCALSGLVPGNNVITVIATDAVGNAATKAVSLYYDNTPPTVTILTPEMGKRYRTPVLNYTLSDDYTAQAATAVASIVGGGTVANDNSLTGLADGEYHLLVVATDAAGNETTKDAVFTVDRVPPALTLDEVTSPTDSRTQTISGTVEDGATVSITTDSTASDGDATVEPGGTWSYEITGLEVGDNIVTVIATDAAGNPSEPVVVTLTRTATPDQIIEAFGHLAIDGTAKRFYTATSYRNPVVIVGPPTSRDVAPGVVRLSDVNGSGFSVRFQEWGTPDGGHTEEQVSYLVLGEGRYPMADGSLWEVGSFSLSGTQQYARHAFSQEFAAPPALFLTVQTANEADAVSVRVRNVTAGTFEAALSEEEAKNNGHAEEKIGYLAVYSPQSSGVAQLAQAALPYLLQRRGVDSALTPVLSSSLKLEEETSADAETVHAAETVSILALGPCLFAQVASDNEADTVALRRKAPEAAPGIEWGALIFSDNAWMTVPLVKGYVDPVVVVKPASANNAEPGYLQVRNVTATSFEVRYDEWAGAWDSSRRQPVQVFYLVAEKGEQNVGGLTVVAGKTMDSSVRYPSWQNVAFASGFTTGPPAVFTSVQTAAGSPVITRVQNVTGFGFEMTLQGAEADFGGAGMETLGWIAIAKGSGITEDGRVVTVFTTAVGSTPTVVNFAQHYPRSINADSFSDRFAERYRNLSKVLGLEDYLRSFIYVKPVLVADLSTTRETDTAILTYRNLSVGGVELVVQEEKSLDVEMQHVAEEVSAFVVD